MSTEEALAAARARRAARKPAGTSAPEAVAGSPLDAEAAIAAARERRKAAGSGTRHPTPIERAEALEGDTISYSDIGRGAVDFTKGAVMGAGDLLSMGGLGDPSGAMASADYQAAEREVLREQGTAPADEMMQGHSDLPGETGAGAYGYRAGQAMAAAAPMTAGMRAAPAISKGPPLVRNLWNAARGTAQTGTAGQAIAREMPPAVGGALGAEAAREASDGSTLAELGGGLAGGVAPAVASTTMSGLVVNPLRRMLAETVGDVGGGVQARSQAKARELVNVGGEAGEQRLLSQLDDADAAMGGQSALLPGHVSGRIGGGPHLSRGRAMAAQDPDYWQRLNDANRKSGAAVADYIERTAPKGEPAVIQRRAQEHVESLLEQPRRTLGDARAKMDEALEGIPRDSAEARTIVDNYTAKIREAQDAFKVSASEKYDAVERHGGLAIPSGQITQRVSPVVDNLGEAEQRALGLLTTEGDVDPGRLSPAIAQVQAWAKRGDGPVALREVESLKRVVNDRIRDPNVGTVEKRVLGDIRMGIDDALTDAADGGALGAPEAVQAFREADAFYREGQKVFADGGLTERFLKGKVPADAYLAKRLKTREGQQAWLDEVSQLRRIGQDETADALESHLDEYLIHDAAISSKWLEQLDAGQDPGISAQRFKRWAADKATILEARPELAEQILGKQTRRELLNRASLQLALSEESAQRHIAGQILGEELDGVVRRVLNPKAGRSVDDAVKELRETIGLDADGVAGVKRGIWDHLTRGARDLDIQEAGDIASPGSVMRLGKSAMDKMDDPAVQKLMRAFMSPKEIEDARAAVGLSVLSKQDLTSSMSRDGSDSFDLDFAMSTGLGNTILRSGDTNSVLQRMGDKALTRAVNWMRGVDPDIVKAAMQDFYADPRLSRALLEGDTVILENWKAMKVNQADRLRERLSRTPVGLASAGVSEAPEREEPTSK